MDKASLILRNAQVVDVERGVSAPHDVAIAGERIQALGQPEEIAALRGEITQVIDLSGKTVVPGFIDSHVHLAWTGLTLVEMNLREARSVADVQDLLAARAAQQPAGTLLRGWGLYENLLRENRFPTKEELDAVAPDHYVKLYREDGHSSAVNTKTMHYLCFTAGMPGVDVVDGEPTGALRAQAQKISDPRLRALEPPGTREESLRAAAAEALRVGLTTVHALDGSDSEPHEECAGVARGMAALPIHTVLWYQTTDLRRVEDLKLPRVGGCLMLDGAPGSYTGALFEPYSDNPSTRGVLYFTDEALEAFVLESQRRGYQLAMHATCQRAIEQLINAYEKALQAYPRADHRLRLEHGYGLPTEKQFERMGELGILLSTQPAFLHFRMDMYYKRFGPRWRGVHPHRMALKHGVTIAGGSDSFVTPMYPLLGIHCAVNHPVEDQRVGVREALRWFTLNGAYAAFEEGSRGTIAPGKVADLTVLGRNILTENALTIKDIPVAMTIVGGVVQYAGGKAG